MSNAYPLCMIPRDDSDASNCQLEVRVLVVDDSHDAANVLTAVLLSANFSARAAYDGPSAVEATSSFLPHVVLLDLDMPMMDGYATAERMRQLDLEKPPLLVAHTSKSDVESIAATAHAGFDLHISKPYEVQYLVDLLLRTLSVRLCGGQPLRLRRD